MSGATLAEIWIYPIKSLDGVRVTSAAFTPRGSLRRDRQWALFDAEGNLINGKREPRMHLIRCEFAPDFSTVKLSGGKKFAQEIRLDDVTALAGWFTDFLDSRVDVRSNTEVGFPDDLDSPAPTIISQASLAEMASWFPGLSAEDLRRRLRPNLIVAGLPPFGEDAWFGPPGVRVPFTIGSVRFAGNNPCQRCVVPSRNPETAEVWPRFQLEFSRRREVMLPEWANRERFSHFYRAAVNTIVETTSAEQTIAVGDVLTTSPQ